MADSINFFRAFSQTGVGQFCIQCRYHLNKCVFPMNSIYQCNKANVHDEWPVWNTKTAIKKEVGT